MGSYSQRREPPHFFHAWGVEQMPEAINPKSPHMAILQGTAYPSLLGHSEPVLKTL